MSFDPYEHARSMTCPFCNESVSYRPNAVIYGGRSYGSGFAYICDNFPDCDSYVGAHGDNAQDRAGMPFGTLADHELRQARKSVHMLIDPYWQTRHYKRREIYAVLARLLEQDLEVTHVGMMTLEQCRKVVTRWFDFVPPLHYSAAAKTAQNESEF